MRLDNFILSVISLAKLNPDRQLWSQKTEWQKGKDCGGFQVRHSLADSQVDHTHLDSFIGFTFKFSNFQIRLESNT